MRSCHPLVLAALLGCGGSVTSGPDGASGAGAGGSAGTADAGADAPVADAGPEWTVPPGQTFSSVSCEDNGMLLFVEIWPSAEAECLPSPELSRGLVVIGISHWDGEPGTFVVGEETAHGTARASLLADETKGTITVEPFETTPRWLAWDLTGAAGRTDLGLCGHFEDFPCPPP